ncbi:endocuticle structural glycoprotein ABD-5-like [Anticarsia gemmatalis]|uniref:endocuticle structural glycoprotein ABD-5-like n=1 Tax=Anticarsia gemmatalis TaxID=129554 RepID=UPI003F75F913
MYRVIVLCGLLSLAATAAIPDESQAKIVKYESSNDGSGNYRFSFETSNGISREEIGHLENVGQEDEHLVVEGSYTYTDVEGKLVVVRYTADKNGYRVEPPQLVPQVVYSLPPSVTATLLGK